MYGSGSSSLFAACRVLFGSEVHPSEEFLNYLQPDGVKTAFRQKAKETHPDIMIEFASCDEINNADRFRMVAEAYKLLSGYLDERERRSLKVKRRYTGLAATEVRATQGTQAEQFYFQGSIPLRPLPLGRYLYYRGLISYQNLITAIVWQRRNRPLLGRLAMEAGWLNGNDIMSIVASKKPGRFGEKAVRMGLLSSIQLSTLLLRQNLCRRRIGDYFVDCAGVPRRDVERLALEMQRHNMQFKV